MVFNFNTFLKGLANTQTFDEEKEKNKLKTKKEILEYILYESETQKDVETVSVDSFFEFMDYVESFDEMDAGKDTRLINRVQEIPELKPCRLL